MKAKIDNLINKKRNKLQDVIPLSTPYSVMIEPSNLCNFKCKFCAPQVSTKKQNYRKINMELELFKKIIDDICVFDTKLKQLKLGGFGEPLINPMLTEMINYAKEKDVAEIIEVVTNGSLLTEQLSDKLINSGIDRILISIEALNSQGYKEISKVDIDMNEMIENIRYLYEHKKKCEIYIKTIDISIKNDEDKKLFYDMFGDICDKIFIEKIIPVWPGFEMNIDKDFKNDLKGRYGKDLNKVKICPYIFYSLLINSDGQIIACCSDWERKLILGDIKDETLVNVWNSDKYKTFWKDMLYGNKNKYEMCRKCEQPQYVCNDNIDEYAEEILRRL